MELQILKIKKATGKFIAKWEDVYNIMKEESMADRECFWVLHLSTQFRVIEKELVGIGALDCVATSHREVFKKAIINSSAYIVCIHNHPSGFAIPSQNDLDFFIQTLKVGKLIGIPVLDLIIIGRGEYYSYYRDVQTKPVKDYLSQIEMFDIGYEFAIHNLG